VTAENSTTRRSPLGGGSLLSTVDLRIAELPWVPQYSVRAADPSRAPLPRLPNSTQQVGEALVLWLGPDEWLVVGEPSTVDEFGTPGGCVVDVSAHRTTLLVTGSRARDVLAHGCALDLHPAAFPAGRCAQTMLAQAPVILVHVASDSTYWVLVRISLARYLAEWLLDAAAGR
jgi:heterotetrameric sarcosine oxidase gamma subunit